MVTEGFRIALNEKRRTEGHCLGKIDVWSILQLIRDMSEIVGAGIHDSQWETFTVEQVKRSRQTTSKPSPMQILNSARISGVLSRR